MTYAECIERTGLSGDELASSVWPIELKFENTSVAPQHASRLELIYTEEFGEFAGKDITVDDVNSHRETVRLEKIICLLELADIQFNISKTNFKKSGAYCIRIEAQNGINLIFHINQDKRRCLLETIQQYAEGYRTYFHADNR
ncbi:hypothetical protein ACI3L1_06920 [Deinococcus sp. SM5_A1]|uniref:hypothetical protein n=1 Tax=Deinococcus sp. SM5_A1 TaxID=3379094 RepID=UPI00385BE86B